MQLVECLKGGLEAEVNKPPELSELLEIPDYAPKPMSFDNEEWAEDADYEAAPAGERREEYFDATRLQWRIASAGSGPLGRRAE